MRLRNGCGYGFGEDFGVGAAEVVGIEGGGVVEVLVLDAKESERESVGGSGLGEESQGRIPAQADRAGQPGSATAGCRRRTRSGSRLSAARNWSRVRRDSRRQAPS